MWKIFRSLVLVFTVLIIPITNSAHILFFTNVCSYSHRVTTYPLADALAKRGHQVTFLSPHRNRGPYENPNITEIVPQSVEKTMKEFLDAGFDIRKRIHKQLPRMVYSFYGIALQVCEELFTSPELQKFMADTKRLDLIIMDNNMIDCGVALAYKFRAKHIFFNVVVHVPNEFDWYGFLPEDSAIPEQEVDPPQTPMTFAERVLNALIPMHFRWVQYNFAKEADKLARKYLDVPDMPFLDDLARNASLILYVGDLISDYPRSHPPLVVNVGGIHCHKYAELEGRKPTLDERKVFQFIESGGSDGFIYISLGTLVLPSTLPETILNMFFGMMQTFPKLKFLWRWDSSGFPQNVPSNLYLGRWFPQRDILAHPKIRGYIMQGGRPSLSEALCEAVPTTALPILGDQDVNARRINKVGGNVLLEWGKLTQEQLEDAVRKMAYDTRLKDRMIELQQILLDQPQKPVEKAVWWVEYCLRHNNTNHLRAAGFDQWWFQRRLLDVWAFLFTIIVVILGILTTLILTCIKCILRQLGRKSKTRQSSTKPSVRKKHN